MYSNRLPTIPMADSFDILNVYLTVDTEIWCDGWSAIDTKFPGAFQKYIYGKTNNGDYGLPFQLKLLKEYDLNAVFFVEPLFATRFGLDALQEIVGLINEYGQSIELHLHTEWVDEAKQPIFSHVKEKREHMKNFSFSEQCDLIALGKDLLDQAGCKLINAFRAGSFGANDDTLAAVAHNQIHIDASYNYCMTDCEISVFNDIQQAIPFDKIIEAPMTTFIDGLQNRRHVQLTACSFAELKSSMQQAHQQSRNAYVFLSHSAELLKPGVNKYDRITVHRFEKFCRFLAENNHLFRTSSFENMQIETVQENKAPIQIGRLPTIQRYTEQSLRKVF